MKKYLLSIVTLLICLPLLAQRDVHKEILIYFTKDVSWEARIINGVSTPVVQVKKETLKQALEEIGIQESDLIVAVPNFNLADTIHVLPDGKVIRSMDMSKLFIYTVKPNQNMEELITKLRTLPEVLIAQKNYVETVPDALPTKINFIPRFATRYTGTNLRSFKPGIFNQTVLDIHKTRLKDISGLVNYKPGKKIIESSFLHPEKTSVRESVVTAYPNPATDVIRLQIGDVETLDSPPSHVYLYDQLINKAVRTVSVNNRLEPVGSRQKDEIELDVRDLPRGIYYLKVISNNDHKTQLIRILLK
ncbi:hypothetical protein AAE02nite_31250 [Adhaeribacter aerolatus]|uniref:Secretion system C-terminal sorting domain-containing protein n=1 Tax=Adhaeribacter aerolatus TaxID=670289 RepID=A0A512B0H8_9BACT|nr:T9SS type A sorting domain-containing protein [Adhaeribacter aerolatus]GEO05461.1 hypothetical protein AAE02nite_31250 [Adhaeribacter aerolatus]